MIARCVMYSLIQLSLLLHYTTSPFVFVNFKWLAFEALKLQPNRVSCTRLVFLAVQQSGAAVCARTLALSVAASHSGAAAQHRNVF